MDYLAISGDNEKLFSFTADHWDTSVSLKHGDRGKLCEGDQPIRHRQGSHLCEVSLLTGRQTLSESRMLKYISVDKLLWHRLSRTNSRMYATHHDSGSSS